MPIAGLGCPGQSRRFWRPEDIYDVPCPHYDYAIEFFRTDVKLKCPQCKREVLNPKVDFACAEWCRHAEVCLGPTTYSVMMEKLELEKSRRADLERLLSAIPQQDREVRTLFRKLFEDNTDPSRLFDVRALYLLRDEEPSLVERARQYYREFAQQLA